MLRSKDIFGLPVYTLSEGKEIGKVTDIMVNPNRGVVLALAVENTSKIVMFSSIKSIGRDAVVIDSTSQLIELSEHRNLERWKDIKIIDSKVIASSGRYLGKVSDYLLDIVTGKIISCVATDTEGERLLISSSRIVTFGKDALIVVEPEIEETLELAEQEEEEQMDEVLEAVKEERRAEREEIKTVLEQLAEEIEKEPEPKSEVPPAETATIAEPEETVLGEQETSPAEQAPPEPIQTDQTTQPAPPSTEPVQEPEGPGEEPPAGPGFEEQAKSTRTEEEEQPEKLASPQQPPIETKAATETVAAAEKDVSVSQAEQQVKRPEQQVQELLNRRQHDFLLGKTVKKDLLTENGALIIKAGQTITEEILNKAKQANKYLELGFYV
jgi:uncharacterized protein YrrD